jgi:SOS-response transcriptional repressor LexA
MDSSRVLAQHSKKRIPLAHSLLSAGEAAEISDDYQLLDVCELITNGREGFIAYEVTGDSMVSDILPGYIVFVDPFCEPRNGDIVASSVNGRNCIKIFNRKPNGLFLVSANTKYKPHEIRPSDNFFILGVVKAHLALHSR